MYAAFSSARRSICTGRDDDDRLHEMTLEALADVDPSFDSCARFRPARASLDLSCDFRLGRLYFNRIDRK